MRLECKTLALHLLHCGMNCRRCIKRLFAVMTILFLARYFTVNTRTNSSVVDHLTNGSLDVSEFLVEYEKYCSSQMIPKSCEIVISATGRSCSRCPCVPHTLGKQCWAAIEEHFSKTRQVHSEKVSFGRIINLDGTRK